MSDRHPILLAEDDANDVFFFQRAARDARVTNPLLVVSDGQEAIDYLSGAGQYADREQFPLPCLLILDLKMPRKTGLEVLQWLSAQQALATLPTIVLSSSAQPEDIERALQLGANAFVVKPSSVESRNELLRSIKTFWLHFNRAPAFCNREISPLLFV